jgi:hypothetical protein
MQDLMVAEDETRGFIPGPLDELVPGLRKPRERWPALPVHPRLLEATRADDSRSLVLASFAPAATLKAYHAALKPLVEAALLSELARPAEELRERRGALRGLELYAFVSQPFPIDAALLTFGLTPAPLDEASALGTLALLRRECQLVEGVRQDEPLARYVARAALPEHPLYRPLAAALLEHAEGGFGAQPGALAYNLCGWLADQGYAGVEPTRAGIERLEALLAQRAPYVIRWFDPIVFQALCDLVAVAALRTWNQDVEWGVCEPDPETHVTPPPVLRVQKERDTFHVPLGEHVLRWCVMPTRVGEQIPSLGEWAEHEFA